jgi:hypothetical protein
MVLSQRKTWEKLKRFGMKPKEQMCLSQVDVIKNISLKRESSFMGRVNDCVHNCLNNSMFVSIMGGIVAFILTLVLGSYSYTWSEAKSDQEEKNEWRAKHEERLDRRFDEIKQGQDKLRDSIEKINDNTNSLLKEILEEQKRSNSHTINKMFNNNKRSQE